MLALMLMVQTIPLPPPQPVAGPVLPKLPGATEGCQRSDDDIVICGQTDTDKYRLRPIGPPPNGKPLPPMTARVGNGTLDLKGVQRTFPGASAPAAMVTLKLPL